MNDFQIRKAIKEHELIKHIEDSDTKIIDEMGLNLGSSIIDIAVVNGSMLGYEIKSDRDTLNRLSGQVEQYNKVFDYLNIVTSKKYASIIGDFIPDWWGIIEVEDLKGNISIHQHRIAKANEDVSSYSLLQLLWKEELVEIIDKFIPNKSMKNKPKKIIWAYIRDNLDRTTLKDLVRYYLKKRINWKV